MIIIANLSPTQERIMKVLGDELPHGWRELHACLNDELCEQPALYAHLSYMRRKLRPAGYDILSERRLPETVYRLVRIMLG